MNPKGPECVINLPNINIIIIITRALNYSQGKKTMTEIDGSDAYSRLLQCNALTPSWPIFGLTNGFVDWLELEKQTNH